MNVSASVTIPAFLSGIGEVVVAGSQPEPDVCVRQLLEEDRAITAAMLSHNPQRGVLLHGLIEDNGFISPFNRGNFYGYFEDNILKGVMLFGHEIILSILPEVEANALDCFARIISAANADTSFILGPEHQVTQLYQNLLVATQSSRLIRKYHFYVCQQAVSVDSPPTIKLAEVADLEAVADANAAMLIEECGIDPFDRDCEGFLQRTSRRIEHRRVWVRKENETVVFKAEVIVQTTEGAYLEGIWVNPQWRGSGIARQCLSELVSHLLHEHRFVCLLVEMENHIAQKLYRHLGFEYLEDYQVRYLTLQK